MKCIFLFRFGRKKTICCGLFFSAVGSFGSVLLTLFDDGNNKGRYFLSKHIQFLGPHKRIVKFAV